MKTRTLLMLPLLLLMALMLTAASTEAQTPAGTLIRNQSSATYEDMVGTSFTALSNEVITIVLPVYGVSIVPDDSGETPPVTPAMTQNAIPGMPVYYRYDLTNAGNISDSFSLVPLFDAVNSTMTITAADVTIIHDLDNDGVIDVGEPVISAGGAPGNVGPLSLGQTISIIVSYTVPTTASVLPADIAYVGVEGVSTNDALQIDTRNYHLTTVVNDAVLTANLSGVPALVQPGNQVTYTLSGVNSGNNAANGVTVGALTGVLFYDVIPTDPSTGNPLAIFGTPTGSPAGGTVLYLPTGSSTAGSPETWAWGTTAGPGDIAVAYITNGNIVVGQNYNFSYQVTIPVGMPSGALNNTATIAYVDNDVVTPDPTLVVSNNALVTVGGVADLRIGPFGNAGAGTAGNNFNDDVQTIPTASAGSNVDFLNTIRNDGNATDQLNILVDALSTYPASWSIQLLQSDGITPLADSGTDGLVDVGPVAPGDSVNIIVRAIIPGSQPAGGPFDVVVRGQSTNNATVFNLTTDRVASVVPAAVDIGNYNGAAGTNNTPINVSTNPSTSVDFPLDVINTGGGVDTYVLTSAVPAGWTVTFYEDINGNGVLDAVEVTPIGATGPVAAAAEVNVIARVDVPAGAAAGLNATSFTATSTNNGSIADTIANSVTVNVFAAVTFNPDRSGTATPGGTVSYQHTVTNTGNVADTFDLTYVSSQGWTYVFYDITSTPITSVVLAPGASAAVRAQLNVPGGVTIGTVETGVLTATGNTTLVSDTATDVTVIVVGNLTLTKSVTPSTDQQPGADLTYTTAYQNVGTDSLTTVVIIDAVPTFTQFRLGTATIGPLPSGITAIAVEYSDDGGLSWVYVPGPGPGSDPNVTHVRFVLTGTLPPGASSTGPSFVVRID